MIRLIALDLDGTTLNSKGKIDPETRNVLEETIAKGVEVVFATGRVLSALQEEIAGIKGVRYAVTSNGANVVDLPSGETLYTSYIDAQAVETVLNMLREHEFMTEVFSSGDAYIEESVFDHVKKNGSPFDNTDYLLSTRKPVAGLYDFILARRDTIENINLNFTKQEDKKMMRLALTPIANISITSSFPYNLEICGLHTSKADALQELCKRLDLTSGDIMACGDNDNDIKLLKYAGTSVAVSNATVEVKEVAGHIAPTNDQCGVAEAIRHFVLRKR